ncbi:uncharacterized protein LOC144132294 isoform X2 [Amblyomma americanum]
MEDDSYMVQHFGISPRSVADSMYNIWFDYTERCLDALKVSIRDKALTQVPPDVLESTEEAIFQAMIPGMNSEASKLEDFLRQDIMHIPPHVLLPEDEVHRNPSSQALASLKLQLESARRRLAEADCVRNWFCRGGCSGVCGASSKRTPLRKPDAGPRDACTHFYR